MEELILSGKPKLEHQLHWKFRCTKTYNFTSFFPLSREYFVFAAKGEHKCILNDGTGYHIFKNQTGYTGSNGYIIQREVPIAKNV